MTLRYKEEPRVEDVTDTISTISTGHVPPKNIYAQKELPVVPYVPQSTRILENKAIIKDVMSRINTITPVVADVLDRIKEVNGEVSDEDIRIAIETAKDLALSDLTKGKQLPKGVAFLSNLSRRVVPTIKKIQKTREINEEELVRKYPIISEDIIRRIKERFPPDEYRFPPRYLPPELPVPTKALYPSGYRLPDEIESELEDLFRISKVTPLPPPRPLREIRRRPIPPPKITDSDLDKAVKMLDIAVVEGTIAKGSELTKAEVKDIAEELSRKLVSNEKLYIPTNVRRKQIKLRKVAIPKRESKGKLNPWIQFLCEYRKLPEAKGLTQPEIAKKASEIWKMNVSTRQKETFRKVKCDKKKRSRIRKL